MPATFEIYAPDNTLQLSLSTKPIGKSVTQTKIQLDKYPPPPYKKYVYSTSHNYSYHDPELGKQVTLKGYWDFGFKENSENEVAMLQLLDGVLCEYNITWLSATVPYTTLGEYKGRCIYVDVSEFTPTPVEGEHLQVFDEQGNMVWGSESLASSLQLIEHKVFDVTGHYYDNYPRYYIDIPPDIDMSRVFVLPVNDTNYRYFTQGGSGGSGAWFTMYIKRVGRRYYFLPNYYMFFNTDTWSTALPIDHSEVQHGVGQKHFAAAAFYLPNPPSI